jgi:hypothetical protein
MTTENQKPSRPTHDEQSGLVPATCYAAWRERIVSLDTEYSRLQNLIDESFAREKQHDENAGERIPLVVKLFAVKAHADDLEAMLDGKIPTERKRVCHYTEKRPNAPN